MCMGGNRVTGLSPGLQYNPGSYQPDPRTYQYDNQGNPLPGTDAASALAASTPGRPNPYATQIAYIDTRNPGGGITKLGQTR